MAQVSDSCCWSFYYKCALKNIDNKLDVKSRSLCHNLSVTFLGSSPRGKLNVRMTSTSPASRNSQSTRVGSILWKLNIGQGDQGK